MRRSAYLLRGGQTHGWYRKYLAEGPDGFKRNKNPTSFNWSNKISITNQPINRPHVQFTIQVDNDIAGKLIIELANDVVPKTVENFIRLCSNEGPAQLNNGGYKGSFIHMIRKGEIIMAGDIEKMNGKGNHSSYHNQRYIKDENFIIPHSERGLISMVSVGIDTSGSQFYIDLAPAHHLNGRCVVFGRIVEGFDVLNTIEKLFTIRSSPIRPVVIADCGLIKYNNTTSGPDSGNTNKNNEQVISQSS